jgi:hypothetical protein
MLFIQFQVNSMPALTPTPAMAPASMLASALLPNATNSDSGMSHRVLDHDLAGGKYMQRWASLGVMEAWKWSKENIKMIKFLKKETHWNKSLAAAEGWLKMHIYVCSWNGNGVKSKYVKKHDYKRKLPAKNIGCPCHLTVKTYSRTSEVLRIYHEEHSIPFRTTTLFSHSCHRKCIMRSPTFFGQRFPQIIS